MTETIIERVQHMEFCMDAVLQAITTGTAETSEIIEMRRILSEYMDSGQWLKDYEADERGELPANLKRGILSQDLLYDLLTTLENGI